MERHVREHELSDRLGLSVRTLQRWRWQGKGPAFLKLGGRVVYRIADIEAWEERNKRAPVENVSESETKS